MSAPPTEAIPVVDLRSLSQSELRSLALSSSETFDPRCGDDVVIPKIDRSVFNESAGSRKQTYSRLRIAPHKPLLPSTSSAAPATGTTANAVGADDDAGRLENLLVVSYLRQLFLQDVHPSSPSSSHALALSVPVASFATGTADNIGDFTGLDEKTAELVPVAVVEDNRDREVLNAKGEPLNLVALGEKMDPFADELLRRTAGLTTEEQLLGFIGGVNGQWGSPRKRRRIVDASWFGDHLPKGWKLLLGLKRKEGDIWVYCRRYISPSGKHFLSCKEVSSYILSLIGHPNMVLPVPVENYGIISNLDKMTPSYVSPICMSSLTRLNKHHDFETVGMQQPAGASAGVNGLKEKHSSSTVVPISSSGDQEKQANLYESDNQLTEGLKTSLTCQRCKLNFNDKNSYVQHQLSCNLHNTKRRKLGKQIAEGVILKDGKFECQICHKTFEERHCYNGHIGVHVRNQGLTAEAPSGWITSEQVCKPTPSLTGSFDISNMTVPTGEGENTFMEGAASNLHLVSPQQKQERKLHEETPESISSTGIRKFMDNQDDGCDVNYCRDQETVQYGTFMVEKADGPKDNKALGDLTVDANLTSHPSPSTLQGSTEENCLNECSNIKVMARDEFEEVHPADVKVINPNIDMVDHFGTSNYESDALSPSKCLDTLCTPTIDDSHVASLAQTSEVCLAPSASTFINNKFANFEVTGYVPEDGGNQSANCVEQNSCENSISTSLVNDRNAALNSSTQIDVPVQPTGYENLISVNDNIVLCENSNEMDVPVQPPSVQNPVSTTYLDINSAECEDSLGIGISLELGAFRNSSSTSLVSVNSVGCENSSTMNVSSTMNPEIEEYNGRDIQLNSGSNLFALPGNRSHFSLETYADIFGSGLEDDVPLQMDASTEAAFTSSQGFSDKDAVTQSCMLDELDANCITMPFLDAQLDSSGRNMQSAFDIDMKKTLFGELGGGNELDSCFSHTVVGGQHIDASDTIQQNTRTSLQADLSLMSPWSSNNIPMVNMIPEQQCEDGCRIGSQNQDDISFNQLRLGTAESSVSSLTNQGSVAGSMPQLTFSYASQLASGSYTDVDLGWGLSLPNSGCQMSSICVWCNRQFSHQNMNMAGEPDSLGFICPTCKAKISSQFRM